MKTGPVKIAEYEDEISAVNAQQFLIDNEIDAMVFTGGIIMQIPRYELHVPAEKSQEALEQLKEFETSEGQAAEGPDDVE